MADVPMRPIDVIFPGRRQAIAANKCFRPSLGEPCNGDGTATKFASAVEAREYSLSGMCSLCQQAFFEPHYNYLCNNCEGACDCHYYADERPCQYGCTTCFSK